MGLKESGLRGSLRNVSVGIDAIPDSVELQYSATTFSNSDSVWADDAGNVDMNINGDPQKATLSDGSESISSDGSNDSGEIEMPSTLEGSGLTEFSFEFVIEHTDTNDPVAVTGSRNSSGGQFFNVLLNRDVQGNTDLGNMNVQHDDDSGNRLSFGPSTNPNLDDGNRHDISVIIHDSTINDVEIIIDGVSVDLSFTDQDGPNQFTTWNNSMATFARNLDGTLQLRANIELGAVRWHTSGIMSQTISEYPFD